MKCSSCGETGRTLTTFFNVSTMKASYLCPKCQATTLAQQIENLEQLDGMIEDLEDTAHRLEEIIRANPKMPEVPEALSSIAFTPLSAYQSMQITIAELKNRRMELITLDDSTERLEYELRLSLEEEDYEKSARIRDKLRSRQAKKDAD